MNIALHHITVRELVEGYHDDGDGGVVGYDGKLDIRPPYQREFVYKDKQRDAVIHSVRAGFPLNVMYWFVKNDGDYEIMDGQQRTLSIAQYVAGEFAIKGLNFHNLQNDEQDQILDYKLLIYFCSGEPSERLRWFKTINIAGLELKPQEMRNAVYAGPWVTDAKRHFSQKNCPAKAFAGAYLKGDHSRQDYLQTAIKWIGDPTGETPIENYMGAHQHDKTAGALWDHFVSIIDWVQDTFPKYRSQMKGVDWGTLYRKFGTIDLDPGTLEEEVSRLMSDYDVEKKSGIYPYVLTRDEKWLNIRAFDQHTKATVYERQGGICVPCNKRFALKDMEADHIEPWSKGGRTILENCQMLCKKCNRRKSAK